MPLEHVQPSTPLPIAERRSAGQNLRKLVPRSLHATWTPPAGVTGIIVDVTGVEELRLVANLKEGS